MKRILLLGSQMETGGAQRLLLDQAVWFQSHGWDTAAAFLYDKESLEDAWRAEYDVRIVNLNARQRQAGVLKNLQLFVKGCVHLLRLLREEKVDVVETFTHHSNLIGIPISWLAGVPVRVATHHGRILKFPKALEKLHAWMVNSWLTSALVAVSEQVRQDAITEGIRAQKITVIPNGARLPDSSALKPDAVREELGLDAGSKLVITVGRMTYEKAQTCFLQAIPAVAAQIPQAVFAVIGDGPLHDDLTAEAGRLGIADRVIFPGIRKDVPDFMAAAQLFVLSSRSEGLPMVLLEAMGVGTAVICTRVGGMMQVIREEETGLLVPAEDAQSLGRAMIELLGDDERRERIAKAGQALVQSEFTFDKMCSRYMELFTSALK